MAEVKLKEWVNECKTYLPDIEVTSKIRMGKPSKEINAEAKFQGNAITVLGTHGCSGVKEFFIGSSAFKTVSGASNPILTIRNNIDIHRDLTDILVVIDDTLETLQKLKYAAVLAKNFQAKIHLLGLYTAKYPEIRNVVNAYLERASIYLTEKNVRFETSTTEVTRKIDTVLLEAKKRNVNLIIVMKELELAGENVFMMAPFSERIVNRSNIPILTVPVDTNIYPKEIEEFISMGKTDKIFPFIIDGKAFSKDENEECFPPSLRNLPKKDERLGGNINEMGRDAAVVKTIAGMLDLAFDTLWQRYEKEKAEEERKIKEIIFYVCKVVFCQKKL